MDVKYATVDDVNDVKCRLVKHALRGSKWEGGLLSTLQFTKRLFKRRRWEIEIPFNCPEFTSAYLFLPSSPRHHFLTSHCHSLYFTTINELTNERTSKRTNKRYVSPSHVMFIFCLPLLTFCLLHHSSFFWHQIGYNDDDDNRDDDVANANSTTASCRPKRLFLKFSNVKNMGKPLNFFFLHPFILSIVDCLAFVLQKCSSPWYDPFAHYHWCF
jgi:hypothetical protein